METEKQARLVIRNQFIKKWNNLITIDYSEHQTSEEKKYRVQIVNFLNDLSRLKPYLDKNKNQSHEEQRHSLQYSVRIYSEFIQGYYIECLLNILDYLDLVDILQVTNYDTLSLALQRSLEYDQLI